VNPATVAVDRGPVLILGARSGIGMAVALRYAARGHPLQLALRDPGRLAVAAEVIRRRHRVAVTLIAFDALDIDGHAAFVDALPELPAIAVSAVGLLGDQGESERDGHAASLVLRANFEGPASVLAHLANAFAARGSGTIVGISSVAGERGRRKNYVYGAAKAGMTAFLSGLRARMMEAGVHVVTVLPGPVATAMTAGRRLPPLVTATAEEVAVAIERAVDRRRSVIYVRPLWRFVMAAVRALPEPLFRRLRL
jgi:decaprenylphospho-beta-D-erythro-pentofuranosid-2-ulose 2-reductase